MKGKLEEAPLADDLLDGVRAIAEFSGWSERTIYAIAPTLPLFKVCGRWNGRKSTLRRHIERLEEKAIAAAE